MKKKLTAIILTICLILTMAGCSGANQSSSDKAPGNVIEKIDESLTIVDQAGREVTVPRKAENVALSYRVVIRPIISLGAGERIKGCGKTEDFLFKLQPSLKKAVDVGKGVADLEALADLAPDVFFNKANDPETLDSVEKLGIPAVGLSFEDTEQMITALDIIGKVLNCEKKADKLITYYKEKVKADEQMAEKRENKKTAIVMGSSIGKVADDSMLQGDMIRLAGGINAAKDLEVKELWPTAGTEQIFSWDPDYIFITGSESANYTAEDIYKKKAWSEMKAVKNRHVFVMPAAEDSWEFPGVVSVLGVDFMISKMYPEDMPRRQLKKNVNEFYRLSYGKTFSEKELGY